MQQALNVKTKEITKSLRLPFSPLNSHYLDLPSITGYLNLRNKRQRSKAGVSWIDEEWRQLRKNRVVYRTGKKQHGDTFSAPSHRGASEKASKTG